MATPDTKFRPYLSMLEMQYIIQVINMANDGSMIGKRVKYSLGKIMFSANAGMATAAYTAQPKVTTLESLGEECELTVAQKREAAYIKYRGAPESCNDEEVMLARTYMYEKNMFTAEEQAEYEAQYLS